MEIGGVTLESVCVIGVWWQGICSGGWNEGGADTAWLPHEQTHSHTHTLNPTHSQGSETLQIETSPPNSPLSSLLFRTLNFQIS